MGGNPVISRLRCSDGRDLNAELPPWSLSDQNTLPQTADARKPPVYSDSEQSSEWYEICW